MTEDATLIVDLIQAGVAPELVGRVVEVMLRDRARLAAAPHQAERPAPKATEPCSVYGLTDPRSQEVFYVGISNKPRIRLTRHLYDPASSAYYRANEVRELGLCVGIRIFGKFQTRAKALDLESKLIRQLPNLLNVAGREVAS
jgi:predicted GIY-YIG superfamily endonuclease